MILNQKQSDYFRVIKWIYWTSAVIWTVWHADIKEKKKTSVKTLLSVDTIGYVIYLIAQNICRNRTIEGFLL